MVDETLCDEPDVNGDALADLAVHRDGYGSASSKAAHSATARRKRKARRQRDGCCGAARMRGKGR
jgi:hypothetical protein